jgi:mannose-6-phosphate isomerase-like protein (cupin superfamily)
LPFGQLKENGLMSSEFVEDPLFRQRYRFSRDGDALRIEIHTAPGGGVLADHVHPQLEERYEVLEGEVTFRVEGKPVVAGPGAKVVVAAGVRHSFQNTGTDTARLDVEADPALRLRESIEGGVSLARAEKSTASGKPRSLRALIEAAALAQRYRDTVVLSSPPRAVQRLLFPLLASFATSQR